MKTNEYIEQVISLIKPDSKFQPFSKNWQHACKVNNIPELSYVTLSYLAYCEVEKVGLISEEVLSKAFRKTYQTLMRNGQLSATWEFRSIWKERSDTNATFKINCSHLVGPSDEQYISHKFSEIKADTKQILNKIGCIQDALNAGIAPDAHMKLIPADLQVLNTAHKLRKSFLALKESLRCYPEDQPIATFLDFLNAGDTGEPESCDELFLEASELSTRARALMLDFEKDTFEHFKREHPDICFENYAQLQAMLAHVGHDHRSVRDWFSYLLDRLLSFIITFGTGIQHPKGVYPEQTETDFNPVMSEKLGELDYQRRTTTGYRLSHANPEYQDGAFGIRNFCFTYIYSYNLINMLSTEGRTVLLDQFENNEDSLEAELRTLYDQANHDFDMPKFIGTISDKSAGGFAHDVFLNAFKYQMGLKGWSKTPRQSAKEVHDLFKCERDVLPKMLCSGFVAKRYISVLYEFNEKLNEKFATTDVCYVDYPFLDRDINIVLPVELHHELDKKGILKKVEAPELMKKTCKFRSY